MDLPFGGNVEVCVTAGDGNHLLDISLEDEWHREIGKMDAANDVSLVAVEKIFFKAGRLTTAVEKKDKMLAKEVARSFSWQYLQHAEWIKSTPVTHVCRVQDEVVETSAGNLRCCFHGALSSKLSA